MSADTAVYTATFGGFDRVPEQPALDGVDFVCFTDHPELVAPGWQIRELPPPADPRRTARRLKLRSHDALPEHRTAIWIDGRVRIESASFLEVFTRDLDAHGIALVPHPRRSCLYDEAEWVYVAGYDTLRPVAGQVRRYRRAGYPVGHGLWVTTVLARRHDRPAVRALEDRWYAELDHGSVRDQISLPYALWHLGVQPARVDVAMFDNPHLHVGQHVRPVRWTHPRLRAVKRVLYRTATATAGRPGRSSGHV